PCAFEGISTWLQRLDRFAQVVERTKEHDEHHCEEAQAAEEPRIYRRGKGRDESTRERAEGGRGRGKRGPRRARRNGATRSRDREAATRARQRERPGPLAEDLVRNARVREQGRQS